MELRELVVSSPHTTSPKIVKGWRAFEVTPRPTASDVLDNVGAGSNARSDLPNGRSAGEVNAPYFPHLNFRKALVPNFFALWLGSPIAITGIAGRGDRSVPIAHVGDVFGLRAPSQMLWITAGRVIAGVKALGCFMRRVSMLEKASDPARDNVLPASVFEHTVSVREAGLSNPRPAFVRPTPIDFGPESSQIFFIKKVHMAQYHVAEGW